MFNNLDYVILIVLFLSGLLALIRGFVRELFSLMAWVGAYYLGAKFYHPALPLAHSYIKNDRVAEWGAMAIVFVVSLILLSIVGHVLCGFVKGRALTIIDRSLGVLYGLARGFLVVSLVYLGARMILWPDIDDKGLHLVDKDRNEPPALLVEAKTRPLLAYGADMLENFVPKEMLDKGLQNVEAQKRELQKEIRDQRSESLEEDSTGPIDVDKLFNPEK